MDEQLIDKRRKYVQEVRNSFYRENEMEHRQMQEREEWMPEYSFAAAVKLRLFLSLCIFAVFGGCFYTNTDICGYQPQKILEIISDNHYYTNLKTYIIELADMYEIQF